jgi:hypothetical protein
MKAVASEVRPYGTIDSYLSSLDKIVRKLVSRGGEPRFVYEVGPCGYGIYRHLKQQNTHRLGHILIGPCCLY